MKTLIQKLEPILLEIEGAIWEREAVEPNLGKHGYSNEVFRASIKIFMAGLMDKIWELQEKENIPQNEREKMAEYAGNQINKIILETTGINTRELYK